MPRDVKDAQSAVGSTRKALVVLEALATAGKGMQLGELAERCELPKSSTHRVLATLREAGWVRVHSSGSYVLDNRAVAFGARAAKSTAVEDVLALLSDDVGHTVHAGVISDDVVVYTHKVQGKDQFEMRSRVGGTMPVHSTGIGKALLAFAPPDQVERVIARGLQRYTPNTITSARALRKELVEIRERGYAIDDEENEANVRCIARAVLTPSGRATTALSIATVTFLTPPEELFGHVGALADAVAQLS